MRGRPVATDVSSNTHTQKQPIDARRRYFGVGDVQMTVRPRIAAISSGLRIESRASKTALKVVPGLCEPSTLARTSFMPASLHMAAICGAESKKLRQSCGKADAVHTVVFAFRPEPEGRGAM